MQKEKDFNLHLPIFKLNKIKGLLEDVGIENVLLDISIVTTQR